MLRLMMVLITMLAASGCSYSYPVIIEGSLTTGPECVPVGGAVVTLFLGEHDQAITMTNSDGSWLLKTDFSGGYFRRGSDKIYRYDPVRDDRYQVRIEHAGVEYTYPIPELASADLGGEMHAGMYLSLPSSDAPSEVASAPE